MIRRLVLFLLVVIVAGTAAPASARTTAALCGEAIRALEARERWLPEGLLYAIALTESAYRPDGASAVVPWPWTINSPKGSFYLASRRQAVAKVEALQAMGVRNIDVGCMQVNLRYHPEAFHSLDDAFHPASNVGYAAGFLRSLERRTPTLFDAVGRYHSATPWRSRAYADKVFARWGKVGDIAAPSKHGLGRPDSPRLADREHVATPAAPATSPGPGRWQRVYGTTAQTEAARPNVLTRSGTGSWLGRADGGSGGVPRGPGQITFR
jgi:hypothetical protein